ncbi:MAG: AhpC/TSA family reductase [Hydrocarboniphaga sp.]|uniref:thioredoxin family protein n=1 Tax=Hydrocarboniphaga sp. TaxID=2033016 RepID=UPI00261F1674|nr:thioredoxin family protein [Hydrocarboniphaga sp.]MDB5972877.1 AhpC/TSA family reductase [Hydrocarboniphaga sp.]
MPRAESTFSLPRGIAAPDFVLPDTVSGALLDLHVWRAQRVTVLMFICNHCPYVLHILEALLQRAREYQARGVAFAAISSNDVSRYPQDAPDAMQALAATRGFGFPYLYDESQSVARAYQAACTPDFYVLAADGRLAWSGRFDESTPGNGKPVTGADLAAALDTVLAGLECDPQARPSIGCSIKWKA